MDKTLLWLILFTLGWALTGGSETEQDAMWHLRKVPRVVWERTFQLTSPKFEAEAQMVLRNVCGIECQEELPAPSLSDLEEALSYETVFENGTRTLTRVRVQGLAPEPPGPPEPAHNTTVRRRTRRQVYGTDSRFSISDKRFLTSFPFSTAVKLSTGCSGVLVSPRHVLTAAHCVHDGRDYVKGSRKLRVGLLKMRKKRGGRRLRGSRRSRREAEGDEQREGGSREDPKEGAKAGGRRRKSSAGGQGGVVGQGRGAGGQGGPVDQGGPGGQGGPGDQGRGAGGQGGPGGQRGPGGRRGPGGHGRGAEGRPSFQWTRVKNTHIPKGWASGGKGAALDYDYALLELKRAHKQKFMELGVSPAPRGLPGGRIHFSGFDRDRADQLVYRFCSVSDASRDLLYQHCDAAPGSAGSGVYLRLREPGRRWARRVIAVHAGHQWVHVGGRQQDYNVAVRITPLKFAQICLWMHGQDADCTAG